MNMNDTEHIWLRQTVTYSVNGQTRTLEIGIPVPREATAEEVEDLLRAADAGMGAISRRLEAHIARASGAPVALNAPENAPDTSRDEETPLPPATEPADENDDLIDLLMAVPAASPADDGDGPAGAMRERAGSAGAGVTPAPGPPPREIAIELD